MPLALHELIESIQHELAEVALPLGTRRTWKFGSGPVVMVKTRNGWVPDAEGTAKARPPKPAEAPKPKKKEEPKPDAKKAEAPKPVEEPEADPAARKLSKGIASEPTTKPPDGAAVLNVDPNLDSEGDGITDAARIGLCGRCTSPPKPIPRLPNLSPEERTVETRLILRYENNPKGMIHAYDQFREGIAKEKKEPYRAITFGTDDVKETFPEWTPLVLKKGADYKPTPEEIEEDLTARAEYNHAAHQVANAIAKQAFLTQLDELARLPKDDPKRMVLVTCGGCASGKGFALKNIDAVKDIRDGVGAIWDSAGEQNGTESPWILEEARKRGLAVSYAFVDADPDVTWGDPGRGMIQRAKLEGRVVDATTFAESYAIGTKNFLKLRDAHADDDDVSFVYLNSRGKSPQMVDDLSPEAKALDTAKVRKASVDFMEKKARNFKNMMRIPHAALKDARVFKAEG